MIWTYCIIGVLLVVAELVYFRIADHFDIIDKPNERSSHSTVVLRGGGVIFAVSMMVWSITPFPSATGGETMALAGYLPFIAGLVLICGVSFWDDVRSLPNSVRLLAQFVAMGLAAWCMIQGTEVVRLEWYWLAMIGIAALVVFVGATNIINFMDGINGITGGYALAVLLPLVLLNRGLGFVEESYLIVAIIGVLVFCFFNFRPKGRAKCFAGDVGSVGIAFIMLFAIGRLIVQTGDLSYLVLLMIYGVDGCLTICHRMMLHENLGEAHRKHAYQLMCNELKMGHVKVSLLYMVLQLVVSLGFICLIPNTAVAHWIYFGCAAVVLGVAYVLFMMKYYHLHEEWMARSDRRFASETLR